VTPAKGSRTCINGDAGLDHLHRLRALVDAVIVGASTVIVDDPLLTTRRVAGESPVRVVIDPRRRLAANHRIFAGPPPTLRLHRAVDGDGVTLSSSSSPLSADCPCDAEGQAKLPLAPRLILASLRRRGLKSVLIEGGPTTVSRFLAAGVLDRLHLIVAPLILGTGVASFDLPPISRISDAPAMTVAVFRLGDDLLIDCVPKPRG
jgi:riboflavin-specific deaminase-like protein